MKNSEKNSSLKAEDFDFEEEKFEIEESDWDSFQEYFESF